MKKQKKQDATDEIIGMDFEFEKIFKRYAVLMGKTGATYSENNFQVKDGKKKYEVSCFVSSEKNAKSIGKGLTAKETEWFVKKTQDIKKEVEGTLLRVKANKDDLKEKVDDLTESLEKTSQKIYLLGQTLKDVTK
jgi:hypothetical protein